MNTISFKPILHPFQEKTFELGNQKTFHEEIPNQEMMAINNKTEQDFLFSYRDQQNQNLNEIDRERITNSLSLKKPLLAVIMKAIENLKKSIIYSSKSSLREKTAHFVNDLSYITKNQNPSNYKNKFIYSLTSKFRYCGKHINRFPVFNPYNTWRIFWDIIIFFFTIFLLFWIPFETGFSVYFQEETYPIFFLVLLIDSIVNMNTGFLVNGYLIVNRMEICTHYLKNFFLLDFISSVGLLIERQENGDNENFNYAEPYLFIFEWFILLRIRNLRAIYSKILEKIYSKFNIRDSYIDLFNLVFINLFIIQIFACIWHFIATDKLFKDNNKNTWIIKAGIESKSNSIHYIYSLYWSCVTIMTVGYGDIAPQNPIETVFTMIAVLFGCLVVAFVISSIGGIMNEFDKESQQFKYFYFLSNLNHH